MREEANQFTTIEVVGALERVQFPAMCVKCGTHTPRTLSGTKLFWRVATMDHPSYYVIDEVDAPFCSSCIHVRGRERQPIDRHVKRRLS